MGISEAVCLTACLSADRDLQELIVFDSPFGGYGTSSFSFITLRFRSIKNSLHTDYDTISILPAFHTAFPIPKL